MSTPLEPAKVVEFFKADIQGDSIHERLFTAGNMYLIAAAIGPEATRNELIPFISKESDFDGEIRAIFAEQLGTFVKYVGGPKHATVLLAPLKNLADSEENFVREKAINSIANVCSYIPPQQADSIISGLLLGLFSGTLTTSKTAACSLLSLLYDKVSDQSKSKLRRAFLSCLRDETPIVRRAGLAALPKLCVLLKQNIIISEIVRQGLSERISDDDESIRVIIPNCFPQIASKLTPQDRTQVLVPLAKSLAKDSSWWVRANMAKMLPNLVPYFATDLVGSDIGAILLFLLRDQDPEVKTAACGCCKQIVDVLAKVTSYFVDSVLPEIQQLSTERFKQVREEVASDILYFARIVPESVAEEKMFPIVSNLISDKERDVIIAILKGIGANFGLINSFSLTKAILPRIIEVAKKEDWRVKIEIIRNFCLFLPFVTPEAIPVQIIPLISDWLQDSVYAVREEMARTLPDFLTVMESDPSVPGKGNRDEIISIIIRLSNSQSYSIRQSSLLAISFIGEVFPSDVMGERILPAVLLMASDQVANVRILASKTLQRLKSYVDSTGLAKINLCLKLLTNDPDPDVKYFSSNR